MEKKIAKCKYCGELFDRNTEPYVSLSNRYAHKACYEKHLEELKKLKLLTDMINEVYTKWDREPNWSLITHQIKKFIKSGLTYEILVDRMTQHMNSTSFNLNRAYGVGFLGYEPCDFYIETQDEAIAKLLETVSPQAED